MTRAEQLRARRRVVEASRRRHAPRTVPAIDPPAALVVSYTAVLRDVSREMDTAITDALSQAGVARADADGAEGPSLAPGELQRLVRTLRQRLGRIASHKALVRAIDQLAQRLGLFNREGWRRQAQALLGIDPQGTPLEPALRHFRVRNLALIRALALDKVVRVHEVLRTHGDARVEVIQKRLREETGITERHAALIARDQVLKLNGELTELHHRAAGITEYTWSTSRDERVRQGHAALEGQRCSYSAPPVVDARTGRRAHPGQDFQCRCVALPVLPGIDD